MDNQIKREDMINELLIVTAISEEILSKMSDQQLKDLHYQKIGSKAQIFFSK